MKPGMRATRLCVAALIVAALWPYTLLASAADPLGPRMDQARSNAPLVSKALTPADSAQAHAVRYIEPARDISLVVGARDPLDLYMREALDWLTATGVRQIVKVADRQRQRPPDVRPGPLTAHVPSLRANDVIHVSGRAGTVGAVEVLAGAVGARCYAIPLDPDA